MISPSDSFDFHYHRDRDDNVTDYDPESRCHSPNQNDECDDEESETTNERLLRLIESCEGRSFSVGGVGGGANEVDAHRLLDLLEKEAAAKSGKRNAGTNENNKKRTKTSDRVSGDKSNFPGRGGSRSRARLSSMGSVSDGNSNTRNVMNCPSKSPHDDSIMSFDGSFTSALLGGPNPPSDDEKEHDKNSSSNTDSGNGSHGRRADIQREKERQLINLGDSADILLNLSDGSDHKSSPGDNFNGHISSSNNNNSGNDNGNLTGSHRGSASSTLSCSFTSTHSNHSYKLEEFNNSLSSLLSSEKKSNTPHQQQPQVGTRVGGSKAMDTGTIGGNKLHPYSSPIKGVPHSTRHHSFDNPFKAKIPVIGTKCNTKGAGGNPKSKSTTTSSPGITTKLETNPASGKHDNILMDVASGGDVAAGGIRDIRKDLEKEKTARRSHGASHREVHSNDSRSVDDNSSAGGDDGDGEDDGHSTLAKYSKYHSVNVNRNSNRTSGTLTTASSTAGSISHDSVYIRPLASECSQHAADENSTGKRAKGKRKGKGNSVSFSVQDTVAPKEQLQDRYHDDEEDDADDEDDQNSDIDEDDETATTTHHTPSLMAEQPSNATPNTTTFSLGSLGSNAVTASTHQSRSVASRTTRSSKSSYSSYGTHSTNSSSNHSALERRHRRELVPGTTRSNAGKISIGTASSRTSGSTSYCSDDDGEYDEEEVTDEEGIYARRRRRRHHRGGNNGGGNGGSGSGRKSRQSKSGGGSMGSEGKGSGSTSPSLSALLERNSKRPILGLHDNQRFPVRFPKGIHEENEDDEDDNDDNGTDTRAVERSIGVNFLDGLLSIGSESTGGLFGRVSKVRDALRNEARSNNNNFGDVDVDDDELFASLIRKKQVPQAFRHVDNDSAKPINNEHDGDTTGDESSILSNILNSHLASNLAKQRKVGSIVSETTGLTTGASTNISSPNIKVAPSSSTKRRGRETYSKSSKRRSSDSENHHWWRTLLRLDIARKAICNNFVLSVNPWSTQSLCQGMVRFYHEGGSVWPRSKKEWIQWGVFALILLPILNVAGMYIATSEASLAAATKRYYGNEVQYFRGSEGAGAEHRLRGARSVLRSSVAKSNAWAGSSQVMLSHSSSLGENLILMPDSDWLDLQISRNQAMQASSRGFLSFFRRGSAGDADLPQPPKRLPLPPMLDHLYDSTSSVVLYFITASNGKDIADQFDPANILSASELNTQANTKLWKDIQTRLNPKPSDVWPCWNHNSQAQFREDGFVLMYPMKRRVHAEKALKKLARDFGQPVFYEFITWTETPSESDFGTGTTLTRVGDAIGKASERASSIRRVGKDGSAIVIPALPGGATDVMIRTTISVRGDKVDVPAVVMRRVKDLPVEDELTMREFEGPPEDEVVWELSAE